MTADAASGSMVVLADAEAVARAAADRLTEAALAGTGRFSVALSGGSTPRRLYELLAGPDYARRFPWERAHLFFGDERFVPPDHADSNYAMVERALLSRVPLPPAQVYRMPTDGDPQDAARRYERTLRAAHAADAADAADALGPRPLFDVVLLGLGENGHTASLFPGTPVLEEAGTWVGCCTPSDAPHDRLTLTYPAIASSAAVLFLVAGAGKADVVARVRAGDAALPASRIATGGTLAWLLDAAAAAGPAHG